MGEHFGIRARPEFVAGIQQLLFERIVIFDDAIVDHGNPARLVGMGMGIDVGGRAMGGPAGVANADATGNRFGLQQRRETLADASHPLAHGEAIAVQHGHSGAVVAAIFQPAQPFQQDGRRRLFTDISDDATHIF